MLLAATSRLAHLALLLLQVGVGSRSVNARMHHASQQAVLRHEDVPHGHCSSDSPVHAVLTCCCCVVHTHPTRARAQALVVFFCAGCLTRDAFHVIIPPLRLGLLLMLLAPLPYPSLAAT